MRLWIVCKCILQQMHKFFFLSYILYEINHPVHISNISTVIYPIMCIYSAKFRRSLNKCFQNGNFNFCRNNIGRRSKDVIIIYALNEIKLLFYVSALKL